MPTQALLSYLAELCHVVNLLQAPHKTLFFMLGLLPLLHVIVALKAIIFSL